MKNNLLLLFIPLLLNSCMHYYEVSEEPNFLIYPKNADNNIPLEIIDQGDMLPENEYFNLESIEVLGKVEETTKEDLIVELKTIAKENPYIDGMILTEMVVFEKEVHMIEETPGMFIFLAALEGILTDGQSFGAADESVWVDMYSLVAYPYIYTENGCFHSVLKTIKLRSNSINEKSNQISYNIYGEELASNIENEDQWIFNYSHQRLVNEKSEEWKHKKVGLDREIRKTTYLSKNPIKVKIYRMPESLEINYIDVKDNGESLKIIYEYESGRISGRTLVFEDKNTFHEKFHYDAMDRIETIEISSLGFGQNYFLDFYYHDPQLIYDTFGEDVFNYGNSGLISD